MAWREYGGPDAISTAGGSCGHSLHDILIDAAPPPLAMTYGSSLTASNKMEIKIVVPDENNYLVLDAMKEIGRHSSAAVDGRLPGFAQQHRKSKWHEVGRYLSGVRDSEILSQSGSVVTTVPAQGFGAVYGIRQRKRERV
ncbi:hypothetical protein EDD85DRAFT_797766 [Armillaria nabsnona]|nr:hypothetical protein EDD85DRAFT_797766 [Armillaria nabsnona]